MLLESIAPVVATIRAMEEEDCVPLSYPYPIQNETNIEKLKNNGMITNTIDDDINSTNSRNNNDTESATEAALKSRNSRQFGKCPSQHSANNPKSSGTSALKVPLQNDMSRSFRLPIPDSRYVSSSSSSSYGSNSGQSDAAAAAMKWKSGVLSSSALSSKVRHTHTHTYTDTYNHTDTLHSTNSHILFCR